MVLGFDVMVRGYPGALFVSAGGYHHHIGLNTWHSAGMGTGRGPGSASGFGRSPSDLPDERRPSPPSLARTCQQKPRCRAPRNRAACSCATPSGSAVVLKDTDPPPVSAGRTGARAATLRPAATWRSGYAAACKAVYTGSIPVVAFGD